jgi:restriction system protein
MLTVEIPGDWRDLQKKVALVLLTSGFVVEIEKKLESVRGSVEVDVYAEEVVNGRKYIVICECKHWRANVPQAVIHGFRTVLSDLGANLGYIITTSDFQSGSFAASNLSNVKLLTWEGFQNEFEESWYPNALDQIRGQLTGGMLSFNRSGSTGYLTEPDKTEVREIGRTYLDFYEAMNRAIGELTWNSKLELPIRANIERLPKEQLQLIPDVILDAAGYFELFREIMRYNDDAFARAAAIHRRNKHLQIQDIDGFVALPHMVQQIRSMRKKS